MKRSKEVWVGSLIEQGETNAVPLQVVDVEQKIEVYYHSWEVYKEVGRAVGEVLALAGFRETDAGTEIGTGVRDVTYRRTIARVAGD